MVIDVKLLYPETGEANLKYGITKLHRIDLINPQKASTLWNYFFDAYQRNVLCNSMGQCLNEYIWIWTGFQFTNTSAFVLKQ